MEYYFVHFVPILLLMTGFPTILIFFMYPYFYSCDFYIPLVTNEFTNSTRVAWNNQHKFGVGLVLYLIFLKPYFVQKLFKFFFREAYEEK